MAVRRKGWLKRMLRTWMSCLCEGWTRIHVTRVQPLVKDYLFLPLEMTFLSWENIVGKFHASPPRHPETPTLCQLSPTFSLREMPKKRSSSREKWMQVSESLRRPKYMMKLTGPSLLGKWVTKSVHIPSWLVFDWKFYLQLSKWDCENKKDLWRNRNSTWPR